MQQYADIYLLLNYSTCFGRPSRPSSGVHKTVVAASGTDHTVWGASLLPRKHDLCQRLQLKFSPHLNFTQLHFTTLSFGLTPFKFPTSPFHLTSLHFTSLHFTSLHFTAILDDFRHNSFLFLLRISERWTPPMYLQAVPNYRSQFCPLYIIHTEGF